MSQRYYPEIDGLRAVAVTLVVYFHAFPQKLSGGFIGVDIFFVISGFLITKNIQDNLQANIFSFVNFYCRRVKRLFPSLLLVLFSSFIFFTNINVWLIKSDATNTLEPILSST